MTSRWMMSVFALVLGCSERRRHRHPRRPVGVRRARDYLVMTNSTVSGNTGGGISLGGECLLSDGCDFSSSVTSNGYNIESPGDTCGFDQGTDLVNITAGQLDLEPLADNGGSTMTHALGAGSVAIDRIPEADCVDAEGEPLTTDQRGFPRDSMCDVGTFEVQEGSL
ncbi:MAG: hypothetical protein JRG93_13305 [Deltaproteobacteria bacterium]|nr:hypothetical protein [Deltaproteobacteria bacterium]MBW2222840.1 hypothetical protein [Deltaproteobacteria bacterium]MBW2402420.1 hypothetical protein [Deltaproteobacteria bacterium]MBW2545741.1 hypothetical protein [Deltaproteobacteria bacterium]MBW2717588.1 hypothetical protein [Deltaproteobacteria bacterium]